MITQVKLVDSAREVREAVAEFARRGYAKDTIFILTHDERRTETLAESTDTHEIGMIDEGVFNAVANLFRSQGDALRAKMVSMGIGPQHAGDLEAELDKGRILLNAWGGNLAFDPDKGDPNIVFSPSATQLNNNIL
jgi:hypothetical protein